MKTKKVSAFQIVTLGSSGVGKTSLVDCFMHRKPANADTVATVGVDFARYNYSPGNGQEVIPIVIWDTGGHEKFRAITTNYIRRAHAIILTYDMTDLRTLGEIYEEGGWLGFIVDNIGSGDARHIIIKIVGTKFDIIQQLSQDNPTRYQAGMKKLDQEVATLQGYLGRHGFRVLESIYTSSRLAINVNAAIFDIGKELYENRDEIRSRQQTETATLLEIEYEEEKKKCCS